MDNNMPNINEHMYCGSCGTPNIKTAKFCKKCGANLSGDFTNTMTANEANINATNGNVNNIKMTNASSNKNLIIVVVLVTIIFILLCVLGIVAYSVANNKESKENTRIEEVKDKGDKKDKEKDNIQKADEQTMDLAATTEEVSETEKVAEEEAEDEEIDEETVDEAEEYEDEYDYYNKDFIFADSNSRYLSENELYGFNKEQCTIARNEIYARHGRKFTTQSIQDYFETKDWYVPQIEAKNFKESMLNKYEIANANMILAYEKDETNFITEESFTQPGSQNSDYMRIDPYMLAGLYASEQSKKAYIAMNMYTDFEGIGYEVGNVEIDGFMGYAYWINAKTIQVILDNGSTFDIKAYKDKGKVKIDILGNKKYAGAYVMVEHYES